MSARIGPMSPSLGTMSPMAAQAAGIVGSEFLEQSWVEKAKTEFTNLTNLCSNKLYF